MFKTTREVRLNFNANIFMLCASRFVLNINYHQLSINYFINFFR